MTEEQAYTELAAALPEYQPRLLPFEGIYRLNLTYSPGRSIEVTMIDGAKNYFVLRNVELHPSGDSAAYLIGAVYGLALIPGIVRNFAALRAATT